MLHVISAFVIAGGRSVRMGRDKALLRLGEAGPTLLERAIELAHSVTDDVRIVGRKELFESWAALNPTLANSGLGWGTHADVLGTGDSGLGTRDSGLGTTKRLGTVQDVFPGQGPLAGIHAALRASASELNLMLAVDTPFVEPRFLRYLVDEARKSGAVVTVPVTKSYQLSAVSSQQERSRSSVIGSQEESSRFSVIGSRSGGTGQQTDNREPKTENESQNPDHRSPTTDHRSQYQPLCAVYRREFADIAEAALRAGRNNIVPLFAQVSTRTITEDELRQLAFDPRMFDNLNTPEDWQRAKDRV